MEYQIIAGTIFVIIFTVTGVIMGFLADKVSRQVLVHQCMCDSNFTKIFSRTKLSSVCIILFSVCGTVMAFATEYWHLVVLRMGIAAGYGNKFTRTKFHSIGVPISARPR